MKKGTDIYSSSINGVKKKKIYGIINLFDYHTSTLPDTVAHGAINALSCMEGASPFTVLNPII